MTPEAPKADSSNTITIKLSGDMDTTAIPVEEMLHRREFERVLDLLKESLKAAENYPRILSNTRNGCGLQKRRHDTLLISGVRGSGKTTFMLSVKERISGGYRYDEDGSIVKTVDPDPALSGIQDLGILDPTLIESKENVFTNLLARICKLAEKMAVNSNCLEVESNGCGRSGGVGKDATGRYRAWETSFKNLAEGLKSMDGVGKKETGDEWMDAEFIMNQGVKHASSANDLEENFHRFINESLMFLGKNAFILFLDDVDTNFSKGKDVLDVLHKYFTTPQLITVLSGDLKLYSTLVRGRQWENYSERMLEWEGNKQKGSVAEAEKRRNGFQEMVSHLEQQYLLKLLRTDRRMFLSSAYQRTLEYYKIAVELNENNTINFTEAYKRVFERLYLNNSSEFELFYRFLAAQPIRTQKQLLQLLVMPTIALPTGNAPAALDQNRLENDKNARVAWRITDIFNSDLWEKRVDVALLRNAPQYTIVEIVNYLIQNGLLEEGYTLRPAFSDDIANSCQFALGAILTTRTASDPSMILDYIIKIGLTREISELIGARTDRMGTTASPTTENYVSHCKLLSRSRESAHVARLSAAYMRGLRGNPNKARSLAITQETYHGTIPVQPVENKGILDILKQYENTPEYIALTLPLSGLTDHRGKSLALYSFYNLLAVISDTIKEAVFAETATEAIDAITSSLVSNSQYREYPIPVWGEIGGVPSEQITPRRFSSKTTNTFDTFLADLSKNFYSWATCESLGYKKPSATATLLGRISTRIFYTFNNMDNELPKQFKTKNENTVDVWMDRMTVAFMNSVLIEELRFYSQPIPIHALNLNNPITSDTIFSQNLDKLNNIDLSQLILPLSRYFLACPLLLMYIKSSELKGKISTLSNFKHYQIDGSSPLAIMTVRSKKQQSENNKKRKTKPHLSHKDIPLILQELRKDRTPIDFLKSSDAKAFKSILIRIFGDKYLINIDSVVKILRIIIEKNLTW